MEKIRALFVTYAATATSSGRPAMMGVIKRCIRLITHLPLGRIEPHLLHFGPLPMTDPLLSSVLPSLPKHTLMEDSPREGLLQLYQSLKPDVVILGEGPGSGMMRAAYRGAYSQGIPIVCIENYYDSSQPALFAMSSPCVQRWLLIGLPDDCQFGQISEEAILVPPLLAPTDTKSGDSVDITIFGYDEKVARLGLELLNRLPVGTNARLVSPTPLSGFLDKLPIAQKSNLQISPLPSEYTLYSYLKTSRIAVCKSGFQQMVESLAVGTPVIAYEASGAVPEAWLSSSLKPFVEYFPKNHSDWTRLLFNSAIWLSKRPVMPWLEEVKKIADPGEFAAGMLFRLICKCIHKRSLFSG